MTDIHLRRSGNPILQGLGVCDPHVRIFNDKAYLYATHDRAADSADFVMEEWWVWSSLDLVHWTHECSLRPEDTYIGRGFRSCWATDAAERNGKYFWYFSEGDRRIGVVVADTPIGPWHDPLGKPLIGDGIVPVPAYDPGILIDDDGTPYIVFGVWDYFIARLHDHMIALAETPRRLTIHHPEGPYGLDKTDDKPYLHKRAGLYYLSWGCYYGIAEDVYGPYECRGSILHEHNVAPGLRYAGHPITFDRHGSFFEWRKQWFYMCNDMSQTRNPFFRDSSICYVTYRDNGEIVPVQLNELGVSLEPEAPAND